MCSRALQFLTKLLPKPVRSKVKTSLSPSLVFRAALCCFNAVAHQFWHPCWAAVILYRHTVTSFLFLWVLVLRESCISLVWLVDQSDMTGQKCFWTEIFKMDSSQVSGVNRMWNRLERSHFTKNIIHIYFLWVFLAYQNTRGTQLNSASERRNGAMLVSCIWVISNLPSHSHDLSLHWSAGKTISSTSMDTCLLPLKRAVFEWESLHLSAATRWENAK